MRKEVKEKKKKKDLGKRAKTLSFAKNLMLCI